MIDIKEVAEDIYRISIPLTGNPLKVLDSYYIRGYENDLVIDTGFRRDDCIAAMKWALEQLGSDPKRRDVAITHFHSDHMGFPDLIKGPERNIYIHDRDLDYILQHRQGKFEAMRYQRSEEEGYGKELLLSTEKVNPAWLYSMHSIDNEIFTPVMDYGFINVGKYKLQLIPVPGHTPGNSMFWDKDREIMFTGDHVLFDITPNITYWSGVENSLGLYIDSLKLAYKYPVKLALPGHREGGSYLITFLLREKSAAKLKTDTEPTINANDAEQKDKEVSYA